MSILLLEKNVLSQKEGEDGVCAGGFAARTHPNPLFIETTRKNGLGK